MSSKFDENMLGVRLFLLSIKIKEESLLYSALQEGIFQCYKGRGVQNFFRGQAPRPPVFSCFFYMLSFMPIAYYIFCFLLSL